MESSTNIFSKIFQIMNHYEKLDTNSHCDDKYNPADNFFSFLFKNMNVTVKPNIEPNVEPNIEPNVEPNIEPNVAPNIEPNVEPNIEPNVAPNVAPNVEPNVAPDYEEDQHREQIINAYIKKCYRIIVLKCHPDKNNKSFVNNNERFIKCHEYYDNKLLIGLLYVFYIYGLTPPNPLNICESTISDENSKILIDRILQEIRVIQEKLI
jgi:hypothetical protein